MHDRFGRPIQVGDKVLVECVAKECYATDEYCNLTLETVLPMFPGENKTVIVVNAKQVVKGSLE